MNALRYQLDFLFALILHPFASQREIFFKLDDANRPNQPTGRKPINKDNFYKNCPIWLKFGMQVSHCPCPPLPPLPTITAPAHPFRRWPQYFSDFFQTLKKRISYTCTTFDIFFANLYDFQFLFANLYDFQFFFVTPRSYQQQWVSKSALIFKQHSLKLI